jgi:tRNA (cytidine/uridine-2'-O-)-methyltransferase
MTEADSTPVTSTPTLPSVLPHIVLYEPEIPPNTGSIIRLCANSGAELHLIEPLGFELDDKRLRRAGLDYHEFAGVRCWSSLAEYREAHPQRRLWVVETPGQRFYDSASYGDCDAIIFGPETRGFSDEELQQFDPDAVLRIPMLPGSRSLNLANAVSIVIYDAWRQRGFTGAV